MTALLLVCRGQCQQCRCKSHRFVYRGCQAHSARVYVCLCVSVCVSMSLQVHASTKWSLLQCIPLTAEPSSSASMCLFCFPCFSMGPGHWLNAAFMPRRAHRCHALWKKAHTCTTNSPPTVRLWTCWATECVCVGGAVASCAIHRDKNTSGFWAWWNLSWLIKIYLQSRRLAVDA